MRMDAYTTAQQLKNSYFREKSNFLSASPAYSAIAR